MNPSCKPHDVSILKCPKFLAMSPVDPALLQLVQQEVKSLEDVVNNMSVEFEEEKTSVQRELQNVAIILEEMKHRVQGLESRTEQVESRIGDFEGIIDI